MSGHNKWSKIKYTKAATDAKRGKVFARFAHEIMLAAKSGGGDPDMNPRLRSAIDGAKAVSTPKENIDRAIKKGTGELGGAVIQEITYEGYGPNGTALLIEVATDNTNRTNSEIRSIFTKNGGSIATPGSVAYQFDRKGEVRLLSEKLDEDSAMELAMEAGADEFEEGDDDNEWVLISSPVEVSNVATYLRENGYTVTTAGLISVAQNTVIIDDLEVAKTATRLYELLDEYDDALNVFTNFDIAEELLPQLDA
ncbi:MAG: YebC/PmpR family DNA-binding transcriptional regulator [Akkermansia sp.]